MFVLLDLEYTSWEGSLQRKWSQPNEFREIIQIGACKVSNVDTLDGTVLFNKYTKPRINSNLSQHIINLTGISQPDIDSASDLNATLPLLLEFIGDLPVFSWGNDGIVIKENIDLYGLEINLDIKSYDIRPIFFFFKASSKVTNSGEAFSISSPPSILVPDSTHNALSDSISLLAGLNKLSKLYGSEAILNQVTSITSSR